MAICSPHDRGLLRQYSLYSSKIVPNYRPVWSLLQRDKLSSAWLQSLPIDVVPKLPQNTNVVSTSTILAKGGDLTSFFLAFKILGLAEGNEMSLEIE